MKPFNLREYIENPSLKVMTRGGLSVQIIKTDLRNSYPIVAIVIENDSESVCVFDENGSYVKGHNSSYDLFFRPEKKEGWMNLYLSQDGITYPGSIYMTKEEALDNIIVSEEYIETIHVEWNKDGHWYGGCK